MDNDRMKFRCWQDMEDIGYGLMFSIFDLSEAGDMCVYNNELDEMKAVDLCTGKYDKNNRLLFEGDIVKSFWKHDGMVNHDYERRGVIVYSKENAAFKISVGKIDFLFPFYSYEREELIEIEFLGTIYESPELLKEVG